MKSEKNQIKNQKQEDRFGKDIVMEEKQKFYLNWMHQDD